MTIAGNNRIVKGVKGDWASKVCRDELIHIIVHVFWMRKLGFFCSFFLENKKRL
jgi:hypothetical protein